MRPVIPAGATYWSGYLSSTSSGPSFTPFKAALQREIIPTTTSEYRIDEAVPCLDQLNIGACVLNSWCGLLEILLGLEGKPVVPLSRLFLYYLCREVMQTIHKDSGTFPFLAAERLLNVGCIPESMWQYLPDLLSSKPAGNTLDLYSAADDNKILGTYQLDNPATMGDDIEACILRDHPVVFAVPVGNALFDAGPNDVMKLPAVADQKGGHCMLITGRRKLNDGTRQWYVRNSWGVDYCDNGHVWFDEPYVLSSTDNWTGTRVNALLV